MEAETVFKLAGYVVLPGWLLLVFAPRWRVTRRLTELAILPLLLSALYLALVVLYFRQADGGFGSLAQVSQLFAHPWVLLAGWVHYLAFDLFIGGWEVADAGRRGIRHLLVVPCLFLTFLFGPVGLLLYFILRWTHPRPAETGVADAPA
jgi:hypothetical protein